MRKATAFLAAVSMTGCYFHAVTEETSRVRYEQGATLVVDEGAALRLDVTARVVRVQALAQRECTTQTFAITETTRQKVAKFEDGGMGDLGGGNAGPAVVILIPVFVIAAVVGVISGIATAIEVGTDDPETWEAGRTLDRTKSEACGEVMADAPIELTLPSGRMLEARTGDDGIAAFAVPEGETTGALRASTSGKWRTSSVYYPTRAACVADREDRFQHSAELPVCEVEREGQDSVEEAWALVAIAVSGDCAAAIDAGRALERRAPSLFEKVAGDSTYANCAAPGDACAAARDAIAKRAMATDDVAERGRIYQSMPRCGETVRNE